MSQNFVLVGKKILMANAQEVLPIHNPQWVPFRSFPQGYSNSRLAAIFTLLSSISFNILQAGVTTLLLTWKYQKESYWICIQSSEFWPALRRAGGSTRFAPVIPASLFPFLFLVSITLSLTIVPKALTPVYIILITLSDLGTVAIW